MPDKESANVLDDDMFARIFAESDADTHARQTDAAEPVKKIRAPSSTTRSVLRNFPTVFVDIAKLEFREAKNGTDAVVAYLGCFCPGVMENSTFRSMLTPAQKNLIRNHSSSMYTDMVDRLRELKKKMDKLSGDVSFLQIIALFTLYDRLGLRESSFSLDSVGGADLLDGGRFLEFYDQMEQAAKELSKRKAARDGRPFGF